MNSPRIINMQMNNTCFICHPFVNSITPIFRLCSMSSAASSFLHIFGGVTNAAQMALKTALVSIYPLYVELFITIDGNRLDPYLAQYATSLSIIAFLVALSGHFDLSGLEKLSFTQSCVLSQSRSTSLWPYREQSSLIPSSHSSWTFLI